MTNSSLFSMFFLIFLVCFAMIGISLSPDATTFDIRWVSATALLVIGVCVIWGAAWMWQIERNLDRLNRILSDEDDELRPELKGVVQLLRQRLHELWKWGVPK